MSEKQGVIKRCEICGQEFYVKRYLVNKRVTCSRKCQGKWQSLHLLGVKGNHYCGGEIRKECLICGKEYYVIRATALKSKYCSLKCSYLGKSLTLIGEKACNYKGGIVVAPDDKGFFRTYIRRGAGKRITNARHKAQQILGRKLKKHEVVHHIDGNKLNDSNSNLIVCSNSFHSFLHWKMGSYNNRKKHRDAIFPNTPGAGV